MTVLILISVTVLHLDHITLIGLSLYKHTNFYNGVVGYTSARILCCHTVAVLNIFSNIEGTRYPMV